MVATIKIGRLGRVSPSKTFSANTRASASFASTRRFSFSEDRHSLSVEMEVIEQKDVRIFDREKTICDAIRFRCTLGEDVVNESIRNYLSGPNSDTDRVIEYWGVLREEGPVRNHLRISV